MDPNSVLPWSLDHSTSLDKSVDAIIVKLPPLSSEDSQGLFLQAKAHYGIWGISVDGSCYWHIMASLDGRIAACAGGAVKSIITCKCYEPFKAFLLKWFFPSMLQHTQRILAIQELGDRHASQVADYLLCTLGGLDPAILLQFVCATTKLCYYKVFGCFRCGEAHRRDRSDPWLPQPDFGCHLLCDLTVQPLLTMLIDLPLWISNVWIAVCFINIVVNTYLLQKTPIHHLCQQNRQQAPPELSIIRHKNWLKLVNRYKWMTTRNGPILNPGCSLNCLPVSMTQPTVLRLSSPLSIGDSCAQAVFSGWVTQFSAS